MASKEEQILRVAKEIVVKFIEVGRISPATFEESFNHIYRAINDAVHHAENSSEDGGQGSSSC